MAESTDESMLEVALSAARSAGEIIRRTTGRVAALAKGGISDLVTESDRECQNVIFGRIRERFPGHKILGEEDVPAGAAAAAEAISCVAGEPFLWVVDPIDGTTNFASGLPLCCVSIAAVRAGRVHAAVIYDPARDEAFTATRGRGAQLNGAPMRVGAATELRDSIIAYGGLGRVEAVAAPTLRVVASLASRTRAMRGLGSAALHLAYVAAGRLDASFDMSLSVWDTAAGTLLVEEAGGRMSNFRGDAYSLTTRDTLASNGAVHQALLDTFLDSNAQPKL